MYKVQITNLEDGHSEETECNGLFMLLDKDGSTGATAMSGLSLGEAASLMASSPHGKLIAKLAGMMDDFSGKDKRKASPGKEKKEKKHDGNDLSSILKRLGIKGMDEGE